MEFRDYSIANQVSFKGAIDLCRDADLTTPEGQAYFIEVFSFLTDSLMASITSNAPEEQAAQIIRGNFPGTTTVTNGGTGNTSYAPQPQPQPQAYAPPQPPQYQQMGTPLIVVKGAQHGELPPWLYEQAAAKGVTEVYDNRDRAASNPKYPWFKSTSGGQQAPAFWPPRA